MTIDNNSSLADKAYQIIEEMIVTLQLAPGSIFSESELSNRIHIGRTPLREALQRLAGERLVSAMPRRGIRVSDLNLSDQLALLETRRVLDRIIVMGAARRISTEEARELKDCGRAIQAAAEAGDIGEFMRQDRRFDQILESVCRNVYAVTASAPLHAHCRRFWYAFRNNGDLLGSAEQHAKVMNAVARGDEKESAAASDELIDYMVSFTHSAINDY